jgi:hypothetical protein
MGDGVERRRTKIGILPMTFEIRIRKKERQRPAAAPFDRIT